MPKKVITLIEQSNKLEDAIAILSDSKQSRDWPSIVDPLIPFFEKNDNYSLQLIILAIKSRKPEIINYATNVVLDTLEHREDIPSFQKCAIIRLHDFVDRAEVGSATKRLLSQNVGQFLHQLDNQARALALTDPIDPTDCKTLLDEEKPYLIDNDDLAIRTLIASAKHPLRETFTLVSNGLCRTLKQRANPTLFVQQVKERLIDAIAGNINAGNSSLDTADVLSGFVRRLDKRLSWVLRPHRMPTAT